MSKEENGNALTYFLLVPSLVNKFARGGKSNVCDT